MDGSSFPAKDGTAPARRAPEPEHPERAVEGAPDDGAAPPAKRKRAGDAEEWYEDNGRNAFNERGVVAAELAELTAGRSLPVMKHVAVDAYPVLHGGPVNETPASVLADEAEGDRRIDEALARIPIDLLLSKPDDELPADIVDEAPLVRAVADEHTGAASTDELPVAGTSVPVIEEPAVVPTDASPAADSVAPAADGENDSSTDPASKLMAFLATHDIPFSDDAPLLYQVHEDLRLVRKWTSLRVLRAPKADTEEPMLLLAGEAPAQLDAVFPANSGPHPDRTRVVIPLAVSATMGASAWYRSAQRALAAVGGGRCATLALVDDDSTTAYYRVFVDWEEIVHPQWKESKSAAPDATANSASGSDS